jgi:hypothetical protein
MLVLIAVFSGVTMGWQSFRAKAYSLMLLAKQLSKDEVLKTGIEQEEFVVNYSYILFEKCKIPVSKETLRSWIQKLYIKAMDYLDDGKINNSYKQ